MTKQYNGSKTAKDGFENEKDVVDLFNNWIDDKIAQQWLKIMGYKLSEIKSVISVIIHRQKADVQVQVTVHLENLISCQNIQVKLVSNKSGYNQVDKRWVDKYSEMWNIPDDIAYILKRYCGEIKPTSIVTKDERRMFMFEFSEKEQTDLVCWLTRNKTLIVSDVLKGRGAFAAEWMLVIRKISTKEDWALEPINFCLNLFGNDKVRISEKGNITIGKITLQRKGGDGGKKTANMLQFKINPAILLNND